MLSAKPLPALGDLKGTIFDFEKAGDMLPSHTHTEDNIHITIVCRGSIKAYSTGWETTSNAGSILDFKVGEPHEIIALENNTRIINIVKKMGGTVGQIDP